MEETLNDTESVKDDYFIERSYETLRVGKIVSLIGIAILGYGVFQDLYLIEIPQLLPWRLIALIPVVLFVIFAFTLFPRKIRWVITSYSIVLSCVMIMILGITLTTLSLNTVPYMYKVGITGGITVAVIVVFIGSGGAKRYIPYIIGIPVGILFFIIFLKGLLQAKDLTLLVNPAIVTGLTIILATVQERLRYKSFLSLRMAKQEIQLREKLQQELRQQATIDDLTGHYNRRALLDILHTFINLAERENIHLTICFIDIDQLKRVNDEYGHAAGDSLIRSLITIIAGQIRSTDTIGRLGGDEFLIIFPHRSSGEAAAIMQRIEDSVEKKNKQGEVPYNLSLSYGLVEYDRNTVNTIDELIRVADTRMYEHKLKKKKTRL